MSTDHTQSRGDLNDVVAEKIARFKSVSCCQAFRRASDGVLLPICGRCSDDRKPVGSAGRPVWCRWPLLTHWRSWEGLLSGIRNGRAEGPGLECPEAYLSDFVSAAGRRRQAALNSGVGLFCEITMVSERFARLNAT